MVKISEAKKDVVWPKSAESVLVHPFIVTFLRHFSGHLPLSIEYPWYLRGLASMRAIPMEATMMTELNDFILIITAISLSLDQCTCFTVVLSDDKRINGSPAPLSFRIYTGACSATVVSPR